MGFSRQEYWNGLPFPSPGDLSDPGIEPGSPALQGESYHLSHQPFLRLAEGEKDPLFIHLLQSEMIIKNGNWQLHPV